MIKGVVPLRLLLSLGLKCGHAAVLRPGHTVALHVHQHISWYHDIMIMREREKTNKKSKGTRRHLKMCV